MRQLFSCHFYSTLVFIEVNVLNNTIIITFTNLFYIPGVIFSILSGVFSTFTYYKGLPLLLKICSQSFTFGEASLVSQSIIIFLYAASVNIFKSVLHAPVQVIPISTLILQVLV